MKFAGALHQRVHPRQERNKACDPSRHCYGAGARARCTRFSPLDVHARGPRGRGRLSLGAPLATTRDKTNGVGRASRLAAHGLMEGRGCRGRVAPS
jgi:hypothetical protein